MNISASANHLPSIRIWLIACMLAVVVMVFVGGVTRLTESGLSIVEWKLFSGVFPPLTDEGWAQALADYQTSPESQIKNPHFGIAEFKGIYWLEYLHRLFGRITGLLFVVPLVVFAARRMLPRPLFWRMFGISALVGTQGLIGWVMVASGLEENPYVNPLKLAMHLSVAFTIFGALLWTYWQLHTPRPQTAPSRFGLAVRGVFALTIIQIVLGAIVAGNDAGYSYNTYPLMDGQWVPGGLMMLDPWWHNITSHIVMVQWQHRMGALVLVASVAALIYVAAKNPNSEIRKWGYLLGASVLVQFALGVATLLSVVDISLASAHQLAALLVIASMLRLVYLTPRHN